MNKIDFLLGLPKTIYFNFKYFNYKTALKLPVLVSHNTKLSCVKGKVFIRGPVNFGMINIGYSDVGIFDKAKSRTIWNIEGQIVFNGIANIGHGSKVVVEKNGRIDFGCNFWITAESQIICRKDIKFGNDVLMSWQCLVMDTDYHKLLKNDTVLNPDDNIVIGNHVWIGCRSTILKGSKIADNSVIAATSTVCGIFDDEYCLIAGVPAKVIKEDVQWNM